MPDTSPLYRPRKPQDSQYYQCVEDHFERLEQVYDERFARKYGFLRPYAELIVMRSPLFAVPANLLFWCILTPHKRLVPQRGNQFVGGLETSRAQFWGYNRFKRFQLYRGISACVHFSRLHVCMPEPERDFSEIIGGL